MIMVQMDWVVTETWRKEAPVDGLVCDPLGRSFLKLSVTIPTLPTLLFNIA